MVFINTKHSESKRLIVFFKITLLWTWTCGLLACLFRTDLNLVNIFFVLGGPAPSIVGFIMVMATYTKVAKKDYFKRMFCIQLKKIKYLMIPVICFTGVTIICCFITGIMGGALPKMVDVKEILSAPYMLFVWLGYSLDKLLERLGVVPNSI